MVATLQLDLSSLSLDAKALHLQCCVHFLIYEHSFYQSLNAYSVSSQGHHYEYMSLLCNVARELIHVIVPQFSG